MAATSTTLSINGGRTGVLLIHGLCGSPTEMRFVANSLTREGYIVLCPELAGHGGSADDLKNSTWQDWLASAEAGLDQLAKTCEKIIVGGLSTGALLALMLAARHPDKVSGLALYSPTLWLNGKNVPWTMRIARRCLAFRAVAKHFDLPTPQDFGIKDARIREFIRASLAKSGTPVITKTPGLAALQRRWLANKVVGLLGGIRQPTLIIHPREDGLADISNAFYLQKNLGGSAELTVLDDSYHLVTIDRQRQLVADITARFAAGVSAAVKPTRPAKTAAPGTFEISRQLSEAIAY